VDELLPILLVVAAALAAGAAYLYGSYQLLVLVLPPVLLAAALLGLFLGLVLGVAAVVSSHGSAVHTLSPQAYHEERTAAGDVGFGPDPGWPAYAIAQARLDIARCWSMASATGERPWAMATGAFFGTRYGDWRVWWFFWPVPVVVLLVLSVMTFASTAVCLLLTVVSLAVTAVVAAGQFFVGGILRALEWAWQKAVRAEASCPHCYFVSPRPAYRCECGELHRDVRPGRLGVLARRCQCGRAHPTTVLRADGHFPAVCQRCGVPLEGGAATVRDVRVPIFGDVSSGKTRFLYAALDAVTALARHGGVPFSHPTEDARREAERALHVIRSGAETTKTSAGSLPTALTCSIGKGATRSLVHLFDAAGEQYGDGGLHDQLGFLHSSRCLVFVIDPFSVPAIRDRIAGANPAAVAQANPAEGDVELFYTGVVHRMRDSGVRADAQRLAVVVSKADLLDAGGMQVPSESNAIADWLTGLGLHNIALSARRDFAEVRFFTVHSTAYGSTAPGRAAADAIAWVLTTSGVRLPARGEKEVTPA
jgi:hypothetical protein